MKKGFTVTEILITMGIIGVVAALVLPQMVSKINRSTVGITLARAVELTEKGFADMLSVARENATNAGIDDPASISRLSVMPLRSFDRDAGDGILLLGNGDALMVFSQSYIGVDDITNDNRINGYLDNFANVNLSANTNILKFKKLNAFMVFDDASNNDNNIADNPDVVIRRIFFDTNGVDAPNAIGEDIFLFGLTDSGHLVPAGTAAYNDNVWNGAIIGMLCNGNTIPAVINNRLSCAARVVQDGWKVTYSY